MSVKLLLIGTTLTMQGGQPPTSFNLECEVQLTSQIEEGAPERSSNLRTIYRIDLQSMRWCKAECRETKPIHLVTDTEIILERYSDPRINAYTDRRVNRESGALLDSDRINDTWFRSRGTCQPVAFTGFPRRRF